MSKKKKPFLLIVVFCSALVLEAFALIFGYKANAETPAISGLMSKIKSVVSKNDSPSSLFDGASGNAIDDATLEAELLEDELYEDDEESISESETSEYDRALEYEILDYESLSKAKLGKKGILLKGISLHDKKNNKKEEDSEKLEFVKVKKDFFDDALFIGDSRVMGIKLYSGLDNATYYAKEGISVYKILDEKIVGKGKKAKSVRQALKNKKFGKIYFEIGINELGTGTIDSFMKKYKEVIDDIRELQPDAKIFVCGILKVTKAKSDSDKIFRNSRIDRRNRRIKKLSDNKDIFYVDINQYVMDDEGNLNSDYTFDAVHLKAKYYKKIVKTLKEHGLDLSKKEEKKK